MSKFARLFLCCSVNSIVTGKAMVLPVTVAAVKSQVRSMNSESQCRVAWQRCTPLLPYRLPQHGQVRIFGVFGGLPVALMGASTGCVAIHVEKLVSGSARFGMATILPVKRRIVKKPDKTTSGKSLVGKAADQCQHIAQVLLGGGLNSARLGDTSPRLSF
jgi:hypothetical protein